MRKSQAQTPRCFFIKVSPGNDKVLVDITAEVQAWFEQPIAE